MLDEIDTLFPFTPRSPEDLRKQIEEIFVEYFENENQRDAKKAAKRLIKNLQSDEDFNFFTLWDALGVSTKDLELENIYDLATLCWSCRAVPPECDPDLEAEQLLKQTIKKGFDKEMHFNFLKKRKSPPMN